MDKIRLGILGCGGIASRFAKALNKSTEGMLYACAAREWDRAQAFGQAHGARKVYGDYDALLADPEVQVVYIATVHTTHADAAKRCIEAGKAVICEKPFFINEKEAQETIALAREKGVLIMEGFWTRTMPAYLKAMEWIREGKIGDISFIRAAFCFNYPLNEQTKEHRLWNPALGGGALLDAGVYPYEYVTGIMGEPPIEMHTMIRRGPTGVDDTAVMTMRWSNGVIADCMTSITGYMDDVAVISGSKGYIKQYYFLGCRKTELYLGQGAPVETYEDPEEEGFVHEIAHFVELYRDGKKESDLIPLRDTLDFARRAEAILTSDQ
ncbi:MAG: Gfo/Idh/MocA family oxidoreductase [Clostridia bacterium]|nr:Gfo/Idh/MocA family oxidoreductase [Clostridia bacterium]